MTFRSLLVAAGVLGSISVASAQTPPAPPAAPPADPTPLQPPQQPAAPAPVAPGAPAAAPGAPAAAPGAPAAAPGAPAAAPGAPAAAPGVAAAPAAAPPAEPAPPAQPEPPAEPPSAPETPRRDAAAVPLVVRSNLATGADAVQEEDEATNLRWRGTSFTWNQAGSTTLFGVGGEYTPDIQVYGWDFTLRPNYYLLDRPKEKVSLSAEIGWLVELTNSDTTATYREPQLKDTTLGARYSRALWESGGANKGEYKTDAAMRLRVTLPTSPQSWNSGDYFTVSLGPQVTQKIKVLGSKADGLSHVTATLGVTYAHLFSRSIMRVNPDIRRLRQNPSGEVARDEQLSGYAQALNRLTTSLDLDVPLYKDLSLGASFALLSRFKPELGEGCVEISTGCAGYDSHGATYLPNTAFDINVSHPVYEVVDVTLGYNNTTGQLGEDGQRRNFFYSPDAQFYLDINANLDVIYSKVTGRGKKAEKAGTASASRRQTL
ncbi:hypothetical protein WME79_16110 [Sorangium sp. So ce726]|uniref:hypothetical protein n=1 Tax=Sorangium sp. So ce726 TaxID=3133319 RepID=UPI003F6285E1